MRSINAHNVNTYVKDIEAEEGYKTIDGTSGDWTKFTGTVNGKKVYGVYSHEFGVFNLSYDEPKKEDWEEPKKGE